MNLGDPDTEAGEITESELTGRESSSRKINDTD